jgi:adenylosuccinate synthase
MRARAVIGANFGDEGKGLVTDYLCAKEGAGMVVRFNGGAQAGHTVVTPDGTRHIFSHIGSGALAGVPTFLSQFFIVNPYIFMRELMELGELGYKPTVYAHPDCVVTTYADMLINQELETQRGAKRHGSVGLGIRETVLRSQVPELTITMGDVWNRSLDMIRNRMLEICSKWAQYRGVEPILNPDLLDGFMNGLDNFGEFIHPLGIGQCKDPVFEGGQGLLLDMDNKEFFPHVTSSNTGMKNVRTLWDGEIETYYVSRTYLTRHGAGPLPGEDLKIRYEDNTNVDHPFQGKLRFAPLDTAALYKRCAKDFGSTAGYRVVLTHCDQVRPRLLSPGDLHSYGPTRDHVRVMDVAKTGSE